MSSLKHAVSGTALSFSLGSEQTRIREELSTAAGSRVGRTLVKDGPLRVTIVGIAAGGAMKEHKAAGPVTIHVLEGEIVLDVEGTQSTAASGMLFALEAGIPHSVQSQGGAVFLLTVVATQPSGSPDGLAA